MVATRATPARYGKDSWAVITGCTDGIGAAIGHHLAKQGFNIVLISRTLTKLEDMAKEFKKSAESKGKTIQTKIVQIDFSDPKYLEASTWEKVYQRDLASLDISILVNNAGTAQSNHFCWIEDKDVHDIVVCNTFGVIALTHQVLDNFRRRYRKEGKRSLICSTSSISSIAPAPFGQAYGASKKFVNVLT